MLTLQIAGTAGNEKVEKQWRIVLNLFPRRGCVSYRILEAKLISLNFKIIPTQTI